ncbi:unnamed protein product [Didymodactylos carnosus]|uniref:Uncharacterized protein n=1 Tax=Didymodactylos carnosus TaxID=1234261 RepID=A0A815N8R7_9BILA|nr:unnamed protein product [Didymodactylos carnosus]CAF1433820.1 unnamed protein product [Didymodactylos carnosus]CAF4069042.1 unnamed protein product [Didymodactylos carnosus]CAF4311739.1 unnamed protein product [Didymodactylos carnosus]
MTVRRAFTVDLQPFSKYPGEEEELLYPGVGFTVERLELDAQKKKHMIYLTLFQQFTRLKSSVPREVEFICDMKVDGYLTVYVSLE